MKSYVSGIQENPELMDIVSKLKDVQINNLTQKSINFEPVNFFFIPKQEQKI